MSYKDLYFKDKVKSLILKDCKKDKNYKISIYKFNQSVIFAPSSPLVRRFPHCTYPPSPPGRLASTSIRQMCH